MTEPDDFYVGYLPRMPRPLVARVRMTVALACLVSVAIALILAARQAPFDPGVFEYGVSRRVEGIVRERPYPTLLVEEPGRQGGAAGRSAYVLVAPGKHGADAIVAGLDGRRVELSGTLVYRGRRTMVEVEPTSVRVLPAIGEVQSNARQALGIRTLFGEIVDSKCYLGVMKPGRSKPHRACAARCISGGIPPLFVVRGENGETEAYLLVSASGGPVNQAVLDFVAEPLEITGRVVREGDLSILEADPHEYRRK